MRHRKTDHREKVYKCRDFLQGKCTLIDKFCWDLHEYETEQNKEKDAMEIGKDSETQQQVFQEEMDKTPPDQFTQIMNMVKKLTKQMDILEKKTMTNQ